MKLIKISAEKYQHCSVRLPQVRAEIEAAAQNLEKQFDNSSMAAIAAVAPEVAARMIECMREVIAERIATMRAHEQLLALIHDVGVVAE